MRLRPLAIPVALMAVAGLVPLAMREDRTERRFPDEPPRVEGPETAPVDEARAILTVMRENDRLRRENARLESENATMRASVSRIADELSEERKRAAVARKSPPAPPPRELSAEEPKSTPTLTGAGAVKRLRTAKSEEEASAAADELVRVTATGEKDETADAMVDILDHDSDAMRRRYAARVLEKIWRRERRIALISQAEHRERDEETQRSLIRIMGRSSDTERASEALLDALELTSSSRIKIEVLQCPLLNISSRFLAEVLMVLHDPDPEVRAAAANLLGKVRVDHGDAVVASLRSLMLNDRKLKVRRAAMDALVERLGAEVAPQFQVLLEDPELKEDAADYLLIFADGASLPISKIVEAKRAREAARLAPPTR